jgi:hypothetical protein
MPETNHGREVSASVSGNFLAVAEFSVETMPAIVILVGGHSDMVNVLGCGRRVVSFHDEKTVGQRG